MSGEPCVFARQNATRVGDELPEQIRIFEIERVDREINLRLWARCADFHLSAISLSVILIWMSFPWHNYLISRCNV